MNKRKEELSRLISIEYFSENPNMEYIHKMEKELETLVDNGKYYVELSYDNLHCPHYLTGDNDLCFSNEPTYFDTKEEAQEYINNARFDKSNFKIRILER